MKKHTLIIALGLMLVGGTVSSQSTEKPKGMINISWQVSTPLAGMKDWIDATTWAGIHFEGLGFISENVAIGGEISHNYSYKRFDEKTYNFSSNNYEGAVTGVQFRSNRMLPILLKGYYYFNSDKPVLPYVGIGAGTVYLENEMAIGIHQIYESQWGFSANAEVGANFTPFGDSGVGIHTAIKYNYSNVNTTTIDASNLSRLNYNLGITFLLRD